MISYLAYTLLGCLLGVLTGLTPGLHVNTVCILGLTVYPRLGIAATEFGVVMVAMSVTHTFLDFIPAIFLGVPEEETALTVLPLHRLLMDGKSYEAVKLTAFGSLIGLTSALLFLLPALYILPVLYTSIREVVVYVIAAVSIILILREGKSGFIKAAFIFACAGWFGYEILHLNILSSTQVLFPAFTGLFGLSTILLSINSKPKNIPQKEYAVLEYDRGLFTSGLAGSFGGITVGVLPSLSPSQVGVLMSHLYGGSVQRFLVSVSAINTSDAIYSLISLYAIGNPRSGVAVMLSKILELDWPTLMLFVGVMASTAFFATTLHLWLGRRAMQLFAKIDYIKVSLLVVAFMTLLVFLLTGFAGLFILALATVMGFMPPNAGVSRTHLMGVLIIPTILFFLGLR